MTGEPKLIDAFVGTGDAIRSEFRKSFGSKVGFALSLRGKVPSSSPSMEYMLLSGGLAKLGGEVKLEPNMAKGEWAKCCSVSSVSVVESVIKQSEVRVHTVSSPISSQVRGRVCV
jgi:hypothetical protein